MKWQSIGQTTSRRTFIKNGLFALAGVAGAAAIGYIKRADIFSASEKKEDSLFSFVQVNDTHIHMPERIPAP